MKLVKTTTLKDGSEAYLVSDGNTNFIFFEGDDGDIDETTMRSAPLDAQDYRYTHGGELYQEACEKLI